MFKLTKYLTLACLIFLGSNLIATTSFGLDLKTSSSFVNSEYSKTISMDFKNASLNDVLKIFSQQSGLNFIAATEVADKTVTLYLDQVPVEEALERILSANDLTYEIDHASNIFVVKKVSAPTNELITRVYRLKHATVPSSKLNKTIIISAGDDDEESTSSLSSDEGDDAKDIGIVGALQAILSESGTIIEDPRTNSLIITDVPQRFTVIEQTLARLDIRSPQILIEVEMLDVAKENIDQLGVKFGSGSIFSFTGGSKQSIYPFNIDDATNAVDVPTLEYGVGNIDFSGFTIDVEALRTATDTKSLARPRILTLNNETAQITIKADEVIGLETTSTAVGSSGASSSLEAERVATGVFLKVTPQANIYTGEIMMAIEPRVIEAKKSKGAFGNNFRDPEERGTKSILRIFDGDTIVIGGLLRTDESRTDTKVPFLSKLPVVGRAFKHDDDAVSERELIIFITPNIVKDSKSDRPTNYSPKALTREQNSHPKRTDDINEALSRQEQKRR